MNHHRPLTYLLLAFGCAALAVLGFLGAASAAGGRAPQAASPALQGIPARPMHAGASGASFTLASTQPEEYHVDLGPLHIPLSGNPDTGTVGSPGTWLSASPDVVSPGGIFATMGSGFAPLETLTYYAYSTPIDTRLSDADGFTPPVAFLVPPTSGSGYILLTVIGATSGRSASVGAYVQANAPQVPGLAVAPHAIRTGDPVHFFAVGYPASTAFNLALDSGAPTALMTDANGRYASVINVTAATGGLVVNTYRTGVANSMAGQSIEVRPDALQVAGPAADLNVSRGFVDRAVLTGTVASAFWFSGEGFQPGESVALSGCATSAFTADSNGSVRAPLNTPAGVGVYSCVYTGATSGRVAYAYLRAAPEAWDVPSALVSPSNTVASGGTVWFLLNHLTPNQGGPVLVDSVSSGSTANINANGLGSTTIQKPITTGGHAVIFMGSLGQVAIAPVFVLPNAGTATPTTTSVPGSTATATATTAPVATSTTTATPPGRTATVTATVPPGSTATATAPPATATPCTASFTDVPPAYWAYSYIQWAACQGIVSGYADHTFRPDNNTTRGQIAKMVVLAAGFALLNPPTPHFSDVPVAHPFYTFIETAYAHQVISGYSDGTFHPGADVTRGQLSKMVVLSQGLPVVTPATPTFNDVPVAHPFYGYIETAVANNIVSGYTCGSPVEPCPGRYFRPNVSATRAQLSKMLYQATHPSQP